MVINHHKLEGKLAERNVSGDSGQSCPCIESNGLATVLHNDQKAIVYMAEKVRYRLHNDSLDGFLTLQSATRLGHTMIRPFCGRPIGPTA